MNKKTYLQSKLSAFEDNIKAHQVELGNSSDTLFEHPGVSFLDKQAEYEKRNFESTERLVEILTRQSTIRGTQHILHKLHTIRNK